MSTAIFTNPGKVPRLPEGWKVRSVESVCSKVTSGGTPLRSRSDYYSDGTIPWIKTSELKDWYIDDSVEKITEKALRETSAKLFPANTVLMAMYGDGRTITSLGILRKEAATNQACCAMIVDPDECDHEYLFYALKHHRNEFIHLASGASQRNLNGKVIKEFEIAFPPLPTQRKIADILSAYDDLIENNTRRIQILEEMAQTIYREWFVNFRFPGHESVEMVESEMGEIPEGWGVKSFSQIADFMNGFAFAPHHWGTVGKPIVKIAELKNGVTTKTPRYSGEEVPDKYVVKTGDVLFSWSADLDAYIWPHGQAFLNQHLFNVIPHEGYSKEFLFYALRDRMQEFRIRSQGTTMRHIKRSALDQVKVTIPTQSLRNRFSVLVEPMLRGIENLTTRNANLRQTRDLLLPKLVSGEVSLSMGEQTTLDGI